MTQPILPTQLYVLDSGGNLVPVGPSNPVPSSSMFSFTALLRRDATQAIANNTATAVAFDALSYDEIGLTTPLSANPTIPAGKGGTYLLRAGFVFLGNAAGAIRRAQIVVNGTKDFATLRVPPSAAIQGGTLSSPRVTLFAGDVVRLVVFQDSGGALNCPAAAANADLLYTWLYLEKVQ